MTRIPSPYRRHRGSRLRTGACALAVLSIAIVSGCAVTKQATGEAGLTGVGAAASANPSGASSPTASGTAVPTVPATATATAAPPRSPAPITYPGTAQDYTADAVRAWADHDAPRLAAYVDNGGAVEFANLPKLGGPWHFHNCVADGDNAACTFDNPVGDRLTVDVIPADLHQPHGVPSVYVDRTEFASDASGYVTAFISAWQNGNVARMTELANSAATAKITTLVAPDSSTMSPPDTTTLLGHTLLPVDIAIGAAQYLITFNVTNGKLGHAHAMTLVSITP
jgi:hypothetical protein